MKNIIKQNLNKYVLLTLVVLSTVLSLKVISAENEVATLRDHTKITEQQVPSRIPKVVNKDIKQGRNYPMQPPIIPHTIRGYEVNINNNKCMSCHSRQRTEESQAPMVSVTHYMNRDGNFLAEISPRRYFCNQCHVIKKDAKPLIENTFIDMHSLMKKQPSTPMKY